MNLKKKLQKTDIFTSSSIVVSRQALERNVEQYICQVPMSKLNLNEQCVNTMAYDDVDSFWRIIVDG